MKVTRSIKCSCIIDAPISFVYDCCTDFRNDDQKMTRNENTRRIPQRTDERIVCVVDYRMGRQRSIFLLSP